jgi:TRAP-type C4-dicarboxylate transport system permease small subunit
LANGLGLVVCLVMFVYAGKSLIGSFSAGTLVYKALIFPEWYLFVLAPITFSFLALIFLGWVVDPDSQRGGGEGPDGL